MALQWRNQLDMAEDSENPEILAIFDLDFTLVDGDTETLWSQFLTLKQHASQEYAARILAYYQDYEQQSLDYGEYLTCLLKPLATMSPALITSLRDEFLTQIQLRIRPQIMECVTWHRDQSHTLLLATATNSFLAESIARNLNFPNLICTRVERNGSGLKISGFPAFREGKVQHLDQWVEDHHMTLADSWAYSDSANDLPLLRRAAHPVAVTPDEQLRSVAEENHWLIIN